MEETKHRSAGGVYILLRCFGSLSYHSRLVTRYVCYGQAPRKPRTVRLFSHCPKSSRVHYPVLDNNRNAMIFIVPAKVGYMLL